MTRPRERILREAAIAENATRYQLVQAAVALGATIVGIPFLIVVLPLVKWYYGRYYETLRVILTNRDLKVHRGILVKEEKTIPLEKITDLRVYEGPIMRRMGLKGLAVETAGQGNPQGALVSLVGIEDVDAFRDAALDQRDRISDADEEDAATPAPPPEGAGPYLPPESAVAGTLTEIRDILRRMEAHLADPAEERVAETAADRPPGGTATTPEES